MIELDAMTLDRVEKLIDAELESRRVILKYLFRRCAGWTESPIEALFAFSTIMEFECGWEGSGYFPREHDEPTITFSQVREQALSRKNGTFGLWPQVQIGDVRVDFVLGFTSITPSRKPIVIMAIVECDGHDFHERTKEQAERDRARDRSFQASDLIVLRFTGRELWRDAAKCADEAIMALVTADSREFMKAKGE